MENIFFTQSSTHKGCRSSISFYNHYSPLLVPEYLPRNFSGENLINHQWKPSGILSRGIIWEILEKIPIVFPWEFTKGLLMDSNQGEPLSLKSGVNFFAVIAEPTQQKSLNRPESAQHWVKKSYNVLLYNYFHKSKCLFLSHITLPFHLIYQTAENETVGLDRISDVPSCCISILLNLSEYQHTILIKITQNKISFVDGAIPGNVVPYFF
jgi:hypothetical protein